MTLTEINKEIEQFRDERENYLQRAKVLTNCIEALRQQRRLISTIDKLQLKIREFKDN